MSHIMWPTDRQGTQHPFKTVVKCSPPGLRLSWCFARLNNYPGRCLWPVFHTIVTSGCQLCVQVYTSLCSTWAERHGGDFVIRNGWDWSSAQQCNMLLELIWPMVSASSQQQISQERGKFHMERGHNILRLGLWLLFWPGGGLSLLSSLDLGSF